MSVKTYTLQQLIDLLDKDRILSSHEDRHRLFVPGVGALYIDDLKFIVKEIERRNAENTTNPIETIQSVSLDDLFTGNITTLKSVDYEVQTKRMEMIMSFQIPISVPEKVVEKQFDLLDNHYGEDFEIQILDSDCFETCYYYAVYFLAKTDRACRYLQSKVDQAIHWFQAGTAS